MGVGTEGGVSGGKSGGLGGGQSGNYGGGSFSGGGNFGGSGVKEGGGQGGFGSQGGGVYSNTTGKTTGKGATGSAASAAQSSLVASPIQNNTSAVVAPSQPLPSAPLVSAPETPSSGGAPNGSGVVGFPNDGYLPGEIQTFDALDLAELLNLAMSNGAPDIMGDIGDEFTDDNLTFGQRIAATATNPIALIAAAALVGIVALKVFALKVA